MKQLLIAIALLTGLSLTAQTPTWQWIKTGGANTSLHQNDMNYRTKQIGTDAQGNIYGIASVSSAGIAIDTLTAVNGFGYDDFVVFSYSCEGQFRWMKRFGCFVDDRPGGIIVDKDGGVYVNGLVSISPYGDAHIADSIIPALNQYLKNYFIAKLDNQGNIVYINFPGPPNITIGATPIRMEADNHGNPVVLTWFSDSTTWNGHHVNGRGHYLVKFNKIDGSLMDIVELSYKHTINSPIYDGTYFNLDENNNCYVMSVVYDSIIVGNTDTVFLLPNHLASLLLKFDVNGLPIWHTEIEGESNTSTQKLAYFKPIIKSDKIYLFCQMRSYPNSSFFGVVINNELANNKYIETSVIASFDISDGSFNTAIYFENKFQTGISPILNSKELIITGGNGGGIIRLNKLDTIKPYFTNSGINKRYPFIVSMDTGLTHFNWGIATKTVLPNTGLTTSCLYVDHNANIILGGGLTGPITNTAGDTTNLVASAENFCIAKIALTNDSCECAKAIPKIAIVSSSGNTLTVKGSATNQPDSLYIVWGDGDSTLYASGSNASHTYTTTGPWNVCLRAYGFCGIEDSCMNNLYSGIYPIENNKQLTMNVYPNPFNERINIELTKNINNGEIYIFDMLGKQVYRARINGNKTKISTATLRKGIYFVRLVSTEGIIINRKLIRN